MKVCPQTLEPELITALNQVARLWHDSSQRPIIANDVLLAWDRLLIEWLNDSSMPLIVRSTKGAPGSEVIHNTKRVLIPSDNSPAQWAFTLAERGDKPTLSQVRQALESDAIPFAMAIKAINKSQTKYFCNLAKLPDNPNNRDWKVGHIMPVGMNLRGNLNDLPIRSLQTHFLNLMSPRNMYVVPKSWAGLSEIEPVNAVFRASIGNSLSDLHHRAFSQP
jgi:hypothetical protein